MAKPVPDQRIIERHELKYFLSVYNRKTSKLVGYIVNISHEGMRLVSSIPLLTHSVFQFQIKLPKEIQGEKVINFDALSCWCRPDVSPDCFDTGFRLVNTPDELSVLIEELIGYFSFKQE